MFNKYLTGLLSFVCFFTFIGPINADDSFKFKGNRKRDQITFVNAGNLIVLKTFINDKGPFNFVMDSGVGITIITDPALKDSLQLSYVKEVKIAGLGELPDFSAYLTPNIKINISNTEAESIGAVILKDTLLHLSQHAGLPIHGLIGYDFFNSFLIKIYHESGYLVCEYKQKLRYFKKGYKIPVSIEKNKPYCKINIRLKKDQHYQLKALIDSGAGHALALESLNEQDFPLPDSILYTSLGIGLNGEINGFIGRIADFEMGSLLVKDLLTSFPSYRDVAEKVRSVPRNASIGNRLLKNFNVTFNYYRNYIHLQPLRKKIPPFEHDMSGLEVIATGDNYDRYIINKVNLHVPSTLADVQEGDELIALDLIPVSKMSLDDVNDVLASRDGRNIYIKVLRNKTFISSIITLKKMI